MPTEAPVLRHLLIRSNQSCGSCDFLTGVISKEAFKSRDPGKLIKRGLGVSRCYHHRGLCN